VKVFHGPVNVAGIAQVLAKAEREQGIESISYCLPSGYMQYSSDRTVKEVGYKHNRAVREYLSFMLHEGWRYDVFNFYFGNSLTLNYLSDIPWLKRLGKKIFFYFHGCDLRDSKAVISKYEFSACKYHWPMECSANRKLATSMALKYANGVFVSTPDLLEFIPNSIWLPQPLDLAQFDLLRESALANVRSRSDQKVIVAHAPSSRQIKGTQFLENAVLELQQSGYPIELMLIEGKSYQEALTLYAESDIVVDQLLIGAYGQFAVELMALGKPVICYIRDDLRQYYPDDLPIISATPLTIAEVLRDLMLNIAGREEAGRKGIQYVNHFHDSRIIAQKSINAYRDA
jgi:glycosyltransferase involved in cell wall biosynthesis